MNKCTWIDCGANAYRSLTMSVDGPVLARLCNHHYAEFMEAPRRPIGAGLESMADKLKKAIYNMPVMKVKAS
jgi:hypothetical protein